MSPRNVHTRYFPCPAQWHSEAFIIVPFRLQAQQLSDLAKPHRELWVKPGLELGLSNVPSRRLNTCQPIKSSKKRFQVVIFLTLLFFFKPLKETINTIRKIQISPLTFQIFSWL